MQGKIWGTTEILLQTPFIEIHRLYIKPYSKCSIHMHKTKHNAFYVEEGKLIINVEKNDYKLTDRTELWSRDFTTVKPGEYHWFETEADDVLAIEIYYPECLSEDIIRKTVGSSKE